MKPSIFSSDYKNRIKRRKRIARNVFLLLFVLIIIVFFSGTMRRHILTSFNSFPSYFGSIFKSKSKPQVKTTKPEPTDAFKEPVSNNSSKDVSSTAGNSSMGQADTGYDVSLSDGQKIKALYNEKDGSKKFTGVSAQDNNNVYSNVSPSSNEMVILDKKAQHIIFIDINGNAQDITKKDYKSTGGTTFTEETYLSENPSYVWADNPTFIDDDNIVFVSQMPQFYRDRTTKYVWIYNTKSKENNLKDELQGQSIKFSTLGDKGLQINIDNNIKYIKADGTISE